MKLTIAALGRMKAGPERELVDTYIERASATGRAIGLGPAGEQEIDNRSLTSASDESRALADDLRRQVAGWSADG